jgi:hypothetical protein
MTPQDTPNHALGRYLLVAVLVLLGLLGAALGCRQIASPDLGWHLSYADWIVEHRDVPTTDPLTYTVPDRDATNPQWLFQLGVHAVMGLAGSAGVVIATIALTLGFAGLLIWRARRRIGHVPLAVVPLLLLFFLGNAWEMRPHLMSWLLGAVVLLILEAYTRGRRRWLGLAPVVMVLWVNLHSVFILGLVILGSYVAADVVTALRQRRAVDRRLLITAAVALACCLINPYHAKALVLPFQQLADLQGGSVFKSAVSGTSEFLSPFRLEPYTAPGGPFALLHSYFYWQLFGVLALLGLVGAARRMRLVDWILFIGFAYLFVTANKNFGFFVMATLPVIAEGLGRVGAWCGSAIAPGRPPDAEPKPRIAAHLTWAVVCAACIVGAWTGWFYDMAWSDNRRGVGINKLVLPVGACAFIEEHGIDGRVLNTWNDGGYITWATGQSVFIYGRGRVMGPELYRHYTRAKQPSGLKELLAKWRPNVVVVRFDVVPVWLPFFNAHPKWRMVYHDQTTAVFCKQTVAPQVPAVDGPQPGEDYPAYDAASLVARINRVAEFPPAGLASWLRGSGAYPLEHMRRSRFYTDTRRWRASVGVSLAGLEDAGFAVPDLLLHLGHALDAQRRYRLADRCYDAYMRVDGDPQMIRVIGKIRAQRAR